MYRYAALLLCVLIAAGGLLAAPAPFPKATSKRPSVSRSGLWEIDLSPLAKAAEAISGTIVVSITAMEISAMDAESKWIATFHISIRNGKVNDVQGTLTHNGVWGFFLPQLKGLTPNAAIKHIALKEIGEASGVVKQSIVVIHSWHRLYVDEVTVSAKGLDKRFTPVVRPPRSKR
jgi:hypothetical protein